MGLVQLIKNKTMIQILDLEIIKAYEVTLKDSPVASTAFNDMVISVVNGYENHIAKNTLKSLGILKDQLSKTEAITQINS